MIKKISTLFIFLLVVFSANAKSCMAPTYPDLDNLDKYSEIFIGEVTGATLDVYERNLLFQLRRKDRTIEVDDSKQGYMLRLVIEKQIKGKTENPYQTQILNCGIEIPSLRAHGIFFIEKETKQIIGIYESQGKIYYESISAVAKKAY